MTKEELDIQRSLLLLRKTIEESRELLKSYQLKIRIEEPEQVLPEEVEEILNFNPVWELEI